MNDEDRRSSGTRRTRRRARRDAEAPPAARPEAQPAARPEAQPAVRPAAHPAARRERDKHPDRRAPGGRRDAEVPNALTPDLALRARDVDRPDANDLVAAERDLVIVRRPVSTGERARRRPT